MPLKSVVVPELAALHGIHLVDYRKGLHADTLAADELAALLAALLDDDTGSGYLCAGVLYDVDKPELRRAGRAVRDKLRASSARRFRRAVPEVFG